MRMVSMLALAGAMSLATASIATNAAEEVKGGAMMKAAKVQEIAGKKNPTNPITLGSISLTRRT